MRSAWLYRVVARAAEDATKRRLFEALEKSALGQAEIIAEEIRRNGGAVAARFRPGARAYVVAALTRILLPHRVRPLLAAMKVRGLSVYNAPPVVPGHVMPSSVEQIGARHRRAGGAGSIRAAVFGANDGLVSNASLILGVAGATEDPRVIVLTGVAGLLAGAFSMAAGEYVSVRSQRDLYEHQIAQERDELSQYPEEEAEELALIYHARGIELEQARAMAQAIFRDPEQALRSLSIEELGIHPDELGSPWAAALSSFLAFACGALVPLAPYALVPGGSGLTPVLLVSAAALFLVGVAISLFSGKSALMGGLRMLLIGCGAGLVTFTLGRLLGVGLT